MPSRDSLLELFPRAAPSHLEAIARDGPALFKRHGLWGRPPRLNQFLAQVGHESAGLTRLEEGLSYSAARLCVVWPARFPDEAAAAPYARNGQALANKVYGGRLGNGDEASGDGWRFRGRGYIQITGRANYRTCGRRAGLDLEARPGLASQPGPALAVALAFWDWKGLNELCDSGDIVRVTRRINGGTHGLADRRAWLDKVDRALLAKPKQAVRLDKAGVVDLQRALQDAGYPECGAADGLIGPRTKTAIARFRRDRGLGEGGIDADLLAALEFDY